LSFDVTRGPRAHCKNTKHKNDDHDAAQSIVGGVAAPDFLSDSHRSILVVVVEGCRETTEPEVKTEQPLRKEPVVPETAKVPETKKAEVKEPPKKETPESPKKETPEPPKKKVITVRQTTDAHRASRAGNLEELQRVVGANEELANAQDPNGWTPLTEAIRSKNLQSVSFLLEKGADPNVRSIHKDGLGGSSLYWAFTFLDKDDAIIALLQKNGAKHYVPLKEEEAPLPVKEQEL
jgi:hypothetical protein